LLKQTGKYVFCVDCPDRDGCELNGKYIYYGSSKLLAFWHKNETPYPGNWMSQPLGFSHYMSVCEEELNNYREQQRLKNGRKKA